MQIKTSSALVSFPLCCVVGLVTQLAAEVHTDHSDRAAVLLYKWLLKSIAGPHHVIALLPKQLMTVCYKSVGVVLTDFYQQIVKLVC